MINLQVIFINILISKEKYKQASELDNEARWKYVFNIVKDIKVCGDDTENGCGCVKPKIKKTPCNKTINFIWNQYLFG